MEKEEGYWVQRQECTWAKVCNLGGNDEASWLEWKACIGQW